MSNIIELKNVNKWFDKFQVLKDINLTVNQKEKIVVCGPSGSGKSTLIRCINRLEEHQEGNIIVDGNEISENTKDIEKIRAEVGMVFQQFNLFPHLSILDNCSLAPIWVKKLPKKQAEEIAMNNLKRVQIDDQALKFPGQLSGGQQQRGERGLGGRACAASDPIPFPSAAFSSPECEPGALGKPEDEESGNFRKNAWPDRSWANRENGHKIRGFAGDERSIL